MRNDEETLDDLLHTYGRDILHFIRFYTKNNNDAEDLTQEVFLRAFKNMATFRQECDAKTWLLKIALNVCRNFTRYQKRHPDLLVDTVPLIEMSLSAEAEAMKRFDAMDLMKRVYELPVKLKEVVLLHYFEDKSVSEIATILGVLESAVKVRLFRARKRMNEGKEGIAHEACPSAGQLKELATYR